MLPRNRKRRVFHAGQGQVSCLRGTRQLSRTVLSNQVNYAKIRSEQALPYMGQNRVNDMCEIFCREACRQDLPGVLRVYAQPDLDDGKTLPLAEAERILDLMDCYPDYKVYVSVIGKNIVGTFTLLVMDNLAHLGAPSAIIEDVAVDPKWQKQGIGTIMMQYALKISADRGCYKAMLSSNLKRERAHAFYEALGFERHGYSYRVKSRLERMIVGPHEDSQ
jgi:GNAT superfamily N-acetyltransferase